MTNHPLRAPACAAALLLAASIAFAADSSDKSSSHSPRFRKITLSKEFWSEGATVGDFNKDGKLDYAAGGFWYEGPDFQKKHTYYQGSPVDPHGYSKNFFGFTDDFNHDGWDDILVVGFPGEDTSWYENPKGKEGDWPRHLALKVTDNESPTYGDLNGDGKKELICNSRGQLGWAEPSASEPNAEWTFHKICAKDDHFQRFTHGLGYGDVNNDGKLDVLEARGWWEQPASLQGDPDWKFHPQQFYSPGHGEGGAQMYAYDVNGDGQNDVITSLQAHGCGLAWFEAKKDSSGEIKFERHLILSDKVEEKINGVQFAQLHAVDLYDMDGDGIKDIVTGKRHWAHGPDGDIDPKAPPVLYWFRLTREGGQVKITPHLIDDDSGVGTQVMACDLNKDGKGDVVVGNKHGQFILIQEPEKTAQR
jgi:hypothetical protein